MITAGVCKSFKVECLKAIHNFEVDVIKIALYSAVANLSPDTTIYSSTDEVISPEWNPGGVQIVGTPGYPKTDEATGHAVWAFNSFVSAATTLTFRAALIYNSSKANRAIQVIDKGIDIIAANGPVQIFNNPFKPFLIRLA